MAFSWNSTPAPNNNNNSNNGGSSGFGGWGGNQSNNNNNNSSSAWGSSNNNNNNNTSGFGGNQTEGSSSWGNNNNSNTNNTSGFGGFGASTNTNSNNANSNNNSNTGFGGGFGAATNNTSIINPNNDYIVPDPPTDAISCLQFHPNQACFIVGSWDNNISMYEFFGNNQSKKVSFQTHDRPVLACSFNESGDTVFSAGCDNQIKAWNPQQNQFVQIGQHQAPIRCVNVSNVNGQCLAISGSWDKTIAIWDIRTNGASTKPVFSNNVGGKVYAMAQRGTMLVVANSENDIKTFDLRQNGKLMHSIKEEEATNKNIKPVNLKKQIRCIDIFPDNNGYVAASIGGRVIIKHFNRGNATKDFSYKCHRHTSNRGSQHVFAVNVLKFHQQSGIFATGGDDGEIVTWDMKGRSKLHNFKSLQIPNYRKPNGNNSDEIDGSRMPIVALDYHSNGQYMLYGSSYNYNKGVEYSDPSQQKPQLYLHQTTKTEFTIKKKP